MIYTEIVEKNGLGRILNVSLKIMVTLIVMSDLESIDSYIFSEVDLDR